MPYIRDFQAEEGIPLCSQIATGKAEEQAASEVPTKAAKDSRSPVAKALAGAVLLGLAGVAGVALTTSAKGNLKVADLQASVQKEGLPTGGKCAQYQCGAPLNQANLCQCDGQCGYRGDCCEDFGLVCREVPPQSGPPAQAQGPIPGSTLYCFSLMVPGSYEEGLLQWQVTAHAGIFTCDNYQVFSNVTKDISGVQTYSIGGTLQVPYHDIYALNTDVFLRLWQVIKYVGLYQHYDWSIKVDIDCVFFPDRFRTFVSRQNNQEIPGDLIPAGPVWLNNCQYGMHGPIEAVSRDGMTMFLDGLDQCDNLRQNAMEQWAGPPPALAQEESGFGEDQFARECWMQLGIPKVNQFETLLSERWNCIERPQDCGGKKIAFHAWKSAEEWGQCWQFAQASGQWPA